ncbi:DNA-directed RNA polymerase III subunit RPC5-like protein [Drosera capensis]
MEFDDILDVESAPKPPPTTAPPPPRSKKPMKFTPRGAKPQVSVKKEEDSFPSQSSYLPVTVEKMACDGGDEAAEMVPELKLEESSAEPMEEEENVTAEANVEKEEDVVECEFDVFFNPLPVDDNTKLYVLQYPLRPVWRPYELDERCTEVRVNPDSADVQVDLMLDVSSEYYDKDADTAKVMKKQMLASSGSSLQRSGYSVGVLEGRKLYLNPVHAVVQLRPDFQYLSGEAPGRNARSSTKESFSRAEESPGEVSGGNLKKQQKQSDQKVAEWISLKYHGPSSFESSMLLDKMLEESKSSIPFTMKPIDYLDSLCPGVPSKEGQRPSFRSYLAMPFEERFKKFLATPEEPPLHRFSALSHLAPDHSVEEILLILQKSAHLVQGFWVPTSTIRYPNMGKQDCFVRDYVLYRFSQNTIFSYSDLINETKYKSKAEKWLREFAVEKPSLKGWKFREPTDESFSNTYPDTVRQQEQEWEERGKKMLLVFASLRNQRILTNPLKTERTDVNRSPLTCGDKGAATSVNGESLKKLVASNEALRRLLMKPLETHKVCSGQTICQGLRDIAVSLNNQLKVDQKAVRAAEAIANAPREEFEAAISVVARKVFDLYVLLSSPEDPGLDPLRNIVVDLLIGKGRNGKLKKAEVFQACKDQLHKELTNHEFQKVITELCVSDRGGSWVLKSGDGAPK